MDQKKSDTADSVSKTPETSAKAEEQETVRDFRLIPGGRRGSDKAIGMSAMERDDVPGKGIDPKQEKYGDSPEGA
jgi:hypothetical protein